MSAPVKSAVAASPLEVVRYLASSPLLTGPLLYLLTGAPADIRERALAPLRPYLLSKDADARIAVTVRILKVLFAIGIGGKINQLLDRLAQNYWYLRRPGAPWRFGDAQNSELVLITGGCSGFGYHTAKALSSKARVIVLDISDCPEDLERRKWHSTSLESAADRLQYPTCTTTSAISPTTTHCGCSPRRSRARTGTRVC